MEISSFVNVTLLATTFTTLFVIMDPPGTIPVFLALTSRYSTRQKQRAAVLATATSFGVIVLFAVLGRYILQFLQISMESLQLSGGVLLFIVAIQLLMSNEYEGHGEPADAGADGGSHRVNAALVPLGTPLLAGPGAIVAVMISVEQGSNTIPGWTAVLAAVILMHLVIWLTMRFSLTLSRLLGEGGIMILTKVAGLLLAAIATQMMMNGLFQFIAHSKEMGVI
ncbi:MarC family protein [Scrofimicrobium sp. R131]|uniref:UPF0056 membrane protein n=1 Tax=Scrofimicrobium appendicitidis TaxID=3079930 RepID=A0AAU7V5L4_9ACTO